MRQPSPALRSPTLIQHIRAWLELVLAAAAGVVFLCLCFQREAHPWSTGLSLFLCLTLLNRTTVIKHLTRLFGLGRRGGTPPPAKGQT
jgi:hypothetical protein